jgi:hypothetical protein
VNLTGFFGAAIIDFVGRSITLSTMVGDDSLSDELAHLLAGWSAHWGVEEQYHDYEIAETTVRFVITEVERERDFRLMANRFVVRGRVMSVARGAPDSHRDAAIGTLVKLAKAKSRTSDPVRTSRRLVDV